MCFCVPVVYSARAAWRRRRRAKVEAGGDVQGLGLVTPRAGRELAAPLLEPVAALLSPQLARAGDL